MGPIGQGKTELANNIKENSNLTVIDMDRRDYNISRFVVPGSTKCLIALKYYDKDIMLNEKDYEILKKDENIMLNKLK